MISKRYVLSILVLSLVTSMANSTPLPTPLERMGACPTGYYSSGNYCVPNSNAKFAIYRNGSCPTEYFVSGNYCVASSYNSKLIMPRIGSCPSGFYASGNYCVSIQ